MKMHRFHLKKTGEFLIALLFVLTTFCVAGQPVWDIYNPYEDVEWETDGRYKASLHTHTTRSDGWMSPQEVVDRYHELDYRILAITDHNAVTWPWTQFSKLKASATALDRIAAGRMDGRQIHFENRDPQQMNMVAIQGNELSQHHHFGSYFSDHNLTASVEESLNATAGKDGLVIINHPGRYTSSESERYTPEWYIYLLMRYSHIAGVEIYNQGDRYPGDRQLYDSILTRLMPGRNVWAYSNDDMHHKDGLGKNWNVFILPDLSEAWVRTGMMEGRSFFVYSPWGDRALKLPEITGIKVDRQQGRIEVEVSASDSIRWISGGKVVARGNVIVLGSCEELAGYVRAEVFGKGRSVTGTQPFGIRRD